MPSPYRAPGARSRPRAREAGRPWYRALEARGGRRPMQAATKLDIFEEIGVQPVINARGHATVLGGSTPTGRVKEAMESAERYYVEMRELLEKSGKIIADLIQCEAAYVTP